MIKSRLDHLSSAQVQKLATFAALFMSGGLVLVKTMGYIATDSLSLLSSLVDSASDIVASLGTFIGVRAALLPADDNHRYGHGKAEAMSALGTSAFILGSAAFLVVEGISRLFHPQEINLSGVGVAIMCISMVATYILIKIQQYAVARSQSTAIAADEMHYATDFIMNGCVIVSLLLTRFTGVMLVDVVASLGMAGWMIYKLIPIAKAAIDMLMDHELESAQREHIKALAAHPLVKGVHDLRTRRAGSDIFIELHLEFEPDLVLRKAHAVGTQVESAIRTAFPHADILVHFDPEGVEEHRLDDAIAPSDGKP